MEADDGESCRLTGMEGRELVGETWGRKWTGGRVPDGEAVSGCCGCEDDLGLSLPVGPLPSGARLAGGRLSAARRVLFSSSSSATLFSRAWRKCGEWVGIGVGRWAYLEMCGATRAESPLYVSCTVRGEVVIPLETPFGGHSVRAGGLGRGVAGGGRAGGGEDGEWMHVTDIKALASFEGAWVWRVDQHAAQEARGA